MGHPCLVRTFQTHITVPILVYKPHTMYWDIRRETIYGHNNGNMFRRNQEQKHVFVAVLLHNEM